MSDFLVLSTKIKNDFHQLHIDQKADFKDLKDPEALNYSQTDSKLLTTDERSMSTDENLLKFHSDQVQQ